MAGSLGTKDTVEETNQTAWGLYLLCVLKFPPTQVNLTSLLQVGDGFRDIKLSAQGPTARSGLVPWPLAQGGRMGRGAVMGLGGPGGRLFWTPGTASSTFWGPRLLGELASSYNLFPQNTHA